MSYRLIAVAAAAVLVLQGCAQKPVPVVQIDTMNEEISKTCTFSPVQPKPGGTVDATITMTNDGWCAYRASESDGKAFMLGLVKQRPAHGELQIRKWNGESRVEYYPNAGFVGADKFSVVLRPQTAGVADSTVQIAATVTRGAGVAAAPPAEEEKKPTTTRRSRAPTRKKPTR